MKKTLSMGAFTELDEREVMDTEGGIAFIPIIIIAGAALLLTGCSSDPFAGSSDGGSKKMYPDPNDFADYRCN